MEIKKVVVGEDEYIFVNTSRSTRNGFAHDTVLTKNGFEIGRHTVHYINRTWESYQYQTVMGSLIWNIIDERAKTFLGVIRAETPSHRLSKHRKEQLMQEFLCRNDIIELHELRQALK